MVGKGPRPGPNTGCHGATLSGDCSGQRTLSVNPNLDLLQVIGDGWMARTMRGGGWIRVGLLAGGWVWSGQETIAENGGRRDSQRGGRSHLINDQASELKST